MFRGGFWRGGRGRGGGQSSLIELTASAGAEQISDRKNDLARYSLLFLTIGSRFEIFACRGPIKNVGENDGRVAKNEMLESFGSDSGNHFPGKVSVFDGRVAKK